MTGVVLELLFFVFIIVVSRKARSGRTNKNASSGAASSRREAAERSAYAVNRTVNALKSTAQKGVSDLRYRSTHADADYDDHLLDYCNSEMPESGGITFKEIPKGVDELVYLRSYNRMREKQLEKDLQNQEANTIHRING